MPVEIATIADIPRLCDLLGSLFTQESEFAPDSTLQAKALNMILKAPESGTILVWRDKGEIVGMVSLLFLISTFLGGRVALLEDMVVDSKRRGKGIGRNLLTAAIEYAQKAGCHRLTLLTDNENIAAKKFYQSSGFVGSSMQPYRLMLTA